MRLWEPSNLGTEPPAQSALRTGDREAQMWRLAQEVKSQISIHQSP